MFQSLFCHWCQTYYLLVRQLLIWFMTRIWSKDVTIEPRGKVELWLCKRVQELVKIVITWCIDNLLKVTKAGYTKKV